MMKVKIKTSGFGTALIAVVRRTLTVTTALMDRTTSLLVSLGAISA
jgi:hypothetical protein